MQIDDMYVEHPRLFLGLLDICQMIILLQLLQYMIPLYVQITIYEYSSPLTYAIIVFPKNIA